MLKNSFVAMATSVHHDLAEVLKQMEEEQKRFKEVTNCTHTSHMTIMWHTSLRNS